MELEGSVWIRWGLDWWVWVWKGNNYDDDDDYDDEVEWVERESLNSDNQVGNGMGDGIAVCAKGCRVGFAKSAGGSQLRA